MIHLFDGPLACPFGLFFAQVENHRPQVKLVNRERRGQIIVIVGITVGMEQIGRMDDRNSRLAGPAWTTMAQAISNSLDAVLMLILSAIFQFEVEHGESPAAICFDRCAHHGEHPVPLHASQVRLGDLYEGHARHLDGRMFPV